MVDDVFEQYLADKLQVAEQKANIILPLVLWMLDQRFKEYMRGLQGQEGQGQG